MNMTNEIDLIFTVSLLAVVVILSGVLLAFLFKHATKDQAYVRTGYGGEVIAQNTGIFIIPILHHALPVNLKAMRLEIKLVDKAAVVTKDYMKVNLLMDFYVRVNAKKESISHVAGTLGELTLFPEQMKDFLAGQLIHAVRKVVSKMTMTEIHQHQSVFVEKIQQLVTGDLSKNSLQVDQVSLQHMEQSAKKFYSEDNAFDAEGLSELTKITQSEKQARHEIEQESLLQVKQKEVEMEKLIIDMENKKSRLRLDQERENKIFEAANKLKIANDAIKKSAEEKQAKIVAEQELEIFKHKSEITLAAKLREKLKQQIETDLIKAKAVKAEVGIKLARKLEKAESQINIKFLHEKRKDEYETAKIINTATARKSAAREDADTLKIKAEAEAEGLKILMDVFSSLSKSELNNDVYRELIELFSDLCLGKHQLVSKFGVIDLQKDNDYYKVNSISPKGKSNDMVNGKTKLQALLDEARTSLKREALNTINDTDLQNSDEFLENKEKA